MSRKSNHEILTIGTKSAPRYVILADGSASLEERQYWTGEGWSNQLGQAVLYANRRATWDDVLRIRAGKLDRR